MSGQQPDDASLPPALRALRDLINAGGWRQLPGPPELVVFLHPYLDGSVDTLSIYGETNALVERTNPNGDPVVSETGTLDDMLDLLHDTPPPDATGAPVLVVPSKGKVPLRPPWML